MRWLFLFFFIGLIVFFPVVGQEAAPERFPPGRDYYVEASVNKSAPFVGERITYTLRFYAYILPETLDDDMPDFQGFWQGEVYELGTTRIETINERQYNVGEVYADLYPLHTGTLTIASAALQIPQTPFSAGERIETQPITIQVQLLPPDAPAGFNGAVGQFAMEAEFEPLAVTQGQPLHLKLTISGSGNFEQLNAPDVPLPQGWRIYDSPSEYRTSELNGLRLGEKTFDWVLIPDVAGTQTLPALNFSYFDPERAQYNTLISQAFTIEVSPGVVRNNPAVDAPQAILPLRSVPSNLQIGDESPGNIFWLLWGVPPIIAFVSGLWVYERERRKKVRQQLRQSQALRRAVKRLNGITRQSNPKQGYKQIEEVIIAYTVDKTGRPAKTIKSENIREILTQINPEAEKIVIACLVLAQERRYAPAGIDEDNRALIADTITALTALDEM